MLDKIETGLTVRTTRELRHPDRPSLPAGTVGTVTAINDSFATVEFDPDVLPDGSRTGSKRIPVAALELVEQPVDLVRDWNAIADIQRESVRRALVWDMGLFDAAQSTTRHNLITALEYVPLNAKRTR